MDYILRSGDLENNLNIAQLQRKFNLVFLEYKPRHTYFFSSDIHYSFPINRAGIIALLTFRKSSGIIRKDGEYKKDDSEHLWHLRSGYLGSDALKHLIQMVRGVKINGIKRIKCEHCVQAHITQKRNYRESDHLSLCPFYRIIWDHFEYE